VSAKTGTYTGNFDAGIADIVKAGTTANYAVKFPFSTIQSYVIDSDQPVTVNTNAPDGTGGNHFDLTVTTYEFWPAGGQANGFSHDVTAVYVINAGTAEAKFNLRVLYN
jgi:hypothetical protein